ncbi:MAG TPA: hypothetical protein VGN35_01290 [Jatrophihabitantaceae bacterium]|nr:hypothetical protein [Jatrophihabitantaceae bacterium]
MKGDRGAQHIQVNRSDVQLGAGRDLSRPDPQRLKRISDDADAGRGLGERARPHGIHATTAECTADSPDVIEVEVGEDEQRDPGRAEVMQTAVDRDGLWTGVDHDRRVIPGPDDHSVALTDITCDESPPGGRPHPGDSAHRNLHEDADQSGRGHYPSRRDVPRQHEHPRDDRDQRRGAGSSGGPRHCRAGQLTEVVSHPRQPPARHCCQLGGDPGGRCSDRRQSCGDETDHRRNGDDGLSKHVRRNGDEADLAGYRRDHRRRDDMGRRGGGEQLRNAGRPVPSPQPFGPPWGKEQQCCSRQYRHGETGADRELRLPQDERDHGHAQRRHGLPRPSDRKPAHGQRSHECGAQHAGRRPSHNYEGDQNEHPHARDDPGPGTESPHAEQHRPDEDRTVHSADGNQMGQPSRAEVLP